jgi:uncharacterized protein with von Willebrand factor type A (vWA) domain
VTLSGPSLRKPDAHSSIHDAALNEAVELRDLFQKCLEDGEKEKAFQVIEVAIEHWESRTLKHAEAEEEGLYKDIVDENPDMISTVIQLTRDHDLMRRIVENMKESLQSHQPDQRMITLLDTLVIIAALGTYMTLIYSYTVVAYEYRLTIGPWFRSIFTFQPLSELMLGIPTLFKVHVILSFFLFASIPFTQLVHMFSFPARYPTRAPQQYRSRDGYDKS